MKQKTGAAVTAVVVVCILAVGILSSARASAQFRRVPHGLVANSREVGPKLNIPYRFQVQHTRFLPICGYHLASLSSDANRFTPAQAAQIAKTEFDH